MNNKNFIGGLPPLTPEQIEALQNGEVILA